MTHPEDVYTWLLRCLVEEATTRKMGATFGAVASDSVLDDVLHHGLMLIARKWDRMNAAAVLDCLPSDILLSDVSECLVTMSIGMMRRIHSHTLQVRRGHFVQCSNSVLPPQRMCTVLNPRTTPRHTLFLDRTNKLTTLGAA